MINRYFPHLYIILFLLLFTSCSENGNSSHTIRIIVTLESAIKNDTVYIAGNVLELGEWDATLVKMENLNDSQRIKTVKVANGSLLEFKFTAGTWFTEAINSEDFIYENFSVDVDKDTTLFYKIYDWNNTYSGDTLRLREKRFKPGTRELIITDNWRYKSGDDRRWSAIEFDDSKWQRVNSFLPPESIENKNWSGIGWFRQPLVVDSSLWGRTFAFSVDQMGASEIYYNGRLLCKIGETGSTGVVHNPLRDRQIRELRIDPQKNHVFAVKYTNYDVPRLTSLNFAPGFSLHLQDVKSAINEREIRVRDFTVREMLFTLIPLILFFIHLFLFIFYPAQKQNLYYCLSLLGFAGLTYFNYEKLIVTDISTMLLYFRLNTISALFAIIFGLFASWAICLDKFPRRWKYYLSAFVILSVLAFFDPVKIANSSNYILFGFCMIDMGISIFRGNRSRFKRGGWVAYTGFGVLTFFVVYQILLDYRLVMTGLFGSYEVYVYGMLGLVLSMSLYLSYNFAYTNKDLKTQLDNVRNLSDKAIEQERIAASLELERRLIEAENVRQSSELESARQLQLSLLPGCTPNIRGIKIDCHVQTAAEVGGDYYDFFVSEKDELTIVIGDATGHGLKAGNMVIVTKGLLNILAGRESLSDILFETNRATKQMGLRMLTMGLQLVRIKEKHIEYSSAGMPPILLFRAATGEVEEHIIKAMTLGAVLDFPWSEKNISFFDGDVLLMMSDGLTELFNSDKELLGKDRVVECLKQYGRGSAGEILNSLCRLSTDWRGEAPLQDDITFLVVKKENPVEG